MDLEGVRAIYRSRLVERAEHLERLLAEGGQGHEQLRALAHKLRGSGRSYGFAELSLAAEVTERAPAEALDSVTKVLAGVMRRVAAGEPPPQVKRVLVADDDEDVLRVLHLVLSKSGVSVSEARHGDRVAEAVCANQPEIVLLDVNMPGPGVRQVLAALAAGEATQEACVVCVSADPHAWRELDLETPPLTKPFDLASLPEQLAERLAMFRAARTGRAT